MKLASDSEESCLKVYEPLFRLIRSIPPGHVMSYGQAADCVDEVRLTARMVGHAMRFAPSGVPWHRVVSANGRLSTEKISPELMLRQRELLLAEGVIFLNDAQTVVDMAVCRYIAH